MGKLINVHDDVIQKLDDIKMKLDCSYTLAIESLLTDDIDELWRPLVNKRFFDLIKIIPDMQPIFEVMRILTLKFHRLPLKTKTENIRDIENQIFEIVKSLEKLEGGNIEP